MQWVLCLNVHHPNFNNNLKCDPCTRVNKKCHHNTLHCTTSCVVLFVAKPRVYCERVPQLGQSHSGPDSFAGDPRSRLHCVDRWMRAGQQSLRQELYQPHPQLIPGNTSSIAHAAVCCCFSLIGLNSVNSQMAGPPRGCVVLFRQWWGKFLSIIVDIHIWLQTPK